VRLAAVREDESPPARRTRRAVIDTTGTLPGRGAYLCRAAGTRAMLDPDCLRLAERGRGIARTLRCAVTLDREIVESMN
jgi:predicted RNA-binding protein YlxR (DUF448 family)